jgi:hypothetical protein
MGVETNEGKAGSVHHASFGRTTHDREAGAVRAIPPEDAEQKPSPDQRTSGARSCFEGGPAVPPPVRLNGVLVARTPDAAQMHTREVEDSCCQVLGGPAMHIAS